MKYHHRLIPLLGALVLLSGCDSDLFKAAPGDYTGFVAEKIGGKIQQTLITSRISLATKSQLNLALYSPKAFDPGCQPITAQECQPKGQPIVTHAIATNPKDSNQISLDGQALKKAGKKNGNSTCFWAGADENHVNARVCFDGKELSIDDLTGQVAMTLVIDKYDPVMRPKLEVPRDFTLTELVNQAIDQSFSSQIQFQQVVQAKLNAQMAWLSLLPHLTIGTFVGQLSTSPPPLVAWNTVVSNIGNLLPFLFPNRWFQAKEADENALAQEAAYVVAKADAGNITEGLAYAVARDTKALASLEASQKDITDIRNMMVARELQGLLEAGSSDSITAILLSMDSTIAALRQGLAQDYSAVSQAAGFINPAAVRSIDMTGQISIENPPSLDQVEIMKIAMDHSFEIKQLLYLEKAARLNKTERWFTWLDPSGSSQGGFGATIVPYLQVAPSQIQMIAKQFAQKQSLLEQGGINLFGQLGMYLAQYNAAKEAVEVQGRNINRVMTDMLIGKTFTLSDLSNAISGQVNSQVNQINAEYAYYIGVSQVNRLIYAGPYTRLAPGDPTPLVKAPPSSVIK